MVSRVGLGCNNFGRRLDEAEVRRVVDAALAAGITFFDTANAYGGGGTPSIPAVYESSWGDSERLLGRAVAAHRDDVVLATKFGNPIGDGVEARGARDYVRAQLEGSLVRLGTDRVDVLYYHRPDGITPLEETVEAMEELVREGKVIAIGCSNLTLDELRCVGNRISALQNHFNLLRRDDEDAVLPLCVELGVGYVPYFPLAAGLLTGKYGRDLGPPPGSRLERRELPQAELDRVEALRRFAESCGHSLLDLAIAWLASHPGVASVIAGATTVEQARVNAAAGAWRLTPGELAEARSIAATVNS